MWGRGRGEMRISPPQKCEFLRGGNSGEKCAFLRGRNAHTHHSLTHLSAGGGGSDREVDAKILAVDISRYIMVKWLREKRRQMLLEASLKNRQAGNKPEAQPTDNSRDALGEPVDASAALSSASGVLVSESPIGQTAHAQEPDVAIEDSATEDSATEDSATEDSATEDSATEDSATEDSATEDEDDEEVNKSTHEAALPDNATSTDRATAETSDTVQQATRSAIAASLLQTSPIRSATDQSQQLAAQPKLKVELSTRPHGCLQVTLGNLPAGTKWPSLKGVLLERCGAVEHSRVFDDSSDTDSTRRCVVKFREATSVSAATLLMGEELFPGHPLKVDFMERRGVWEWLPEPEESDTPVENNKSKKIMEVPAETAQQAAERRLKIPRIPVAELRSYCKQLITPELNAAVTALLQKLKFFQDRLKAQDAVKAKMRRRFVLGLREVRRGVLARKVKCVIMTPNIEKVEAHGGLDSFITQIITECEKDREDGDEDIEIDKIPLVFALTRNKLGKALGKPMTLSVVGLYDVNGAFEEYKEVLKLAAEGRSAWLAETLRPKIAQPQAQPKTKQLSKKDAPTEDKNNLALTQAPRRQLNANAPAFVVPEMNQCKPAWFSVPYVQPCGYGTAEVAVGPSIPSIVAGILQQNSSTSGTSPDNTT
jgi:ribosomal protein L7Ae-like RNA K-turn-binding protein